jgi:hypothetical protein
MFFVEVGFHLHHLCCMVTYSQGSKQSFLLKPGYGLITRISGLTTRQNTRARWHLGGINQFTQISMSGKASTLPFQIPISPDSIESEVLCYSKNINYCKPSFQKVAVTNQGIPDPHITIVLALCSRDVESMSISFILHATCFFGACNKEFLSRFPLQFL